MLVDFEQQSLAREALLARLDDPAALEALFRERPVAFAEALSVALDQAPEHVVLRVWAARLDLELGDPGPAPEPTGWRWAELLDADRALLLLGAVALVVLLAGTWAKLPALLGWAVSYEAGGATRVDRFYMRSVPFLAVVPLIALFALRYRPPGRVLAAIGASVAVLVAVQAVRPIETDAGVLSVLHVPLVLLALAGATALGARWRETDGRVGVLQLMGEAAAFAGLLGLGGILLVTVTAALFSAIGVPFEEILFEWAVVYGVLGVVPVGALVAGQRVEATRIAPLIARVFGPMALVVLTIYLPTLVATGGLEDRDSLLALNVALVAVLALVILMQAERPDVPRHWTDAVAFGLVAVALVADLAALGSIAGRLLGGLTPNRLAVVGLNALVAVHFAGLVAPLARRALGRGEWPGDGWTARFLTVYAGWAAVVVLVFPFLF